MVGLGGETTYLYITVNRVVKCGVVKIEFVKLWDLTRFLERASSKNKPLAKK